MKTRHTPRHAVRHTGRTRPPQVVVQAQRESVRLLATHASAVEQATQAEGRYAAAQESSGFEARAAGLQRNLDEAVGSLAGASRRASELAVRSAAAADELVALRKAAAHAGRAHSVPVESVTARRRAEVARARLERTQSATNDSLRAAEAAKVEADSLIKRRAVFRERMAQVV